MALIRELHQKWMREPGYRREYLSLEKEFEAASKAAELRKVERVNLTSVIEFDTDTNNLWVFFSLSVERARFDFYDRKSPLYRDGRYRFVEELEGLQDLIFH